MTVLKLLGAALILLTGSFAAYHTAQYEKKRLSVLDSWIDLIYFIKGQIDCFLTPLDEILSLADRELLQGCMLRSANSLSLASLYRTSLSYLTPESARLLGSFVREIGKSNREEQVRRCDYYLTGLRNIREKQALEQPARIRVGCSLCLCISATIAILLW